MSLTFPIIHLNGSSKSFLQEEYRLAARSVRATIDVVAKVYPHGRDYYPISPDALLSAQAEHAARLSKLREVAEELEAIWENLSDQR